MTAVHPPARPRRIAAPHRRLRLAGTLAGVGLRSALLPREAFRQRGRVQVCGAARVLTTLGVRVQVVPPPAPWPRDGRLAVNGASGRVAELAVLTAVPRTVPGWTGLAEHALLGRAAEPSPAVAGDVLLPVVVRFRRDGEDGWLDGAQVPRDPDAVPPGWWSRCGCCRRWRPPPADAGTRHAAAGGPARDPALASWRRPERRAEEGGPERWTRACCARSSPSPTSCTSVAPPSGSTSPSPRCRSRSASWRRRSGRRCSTAAGGWS